MSPSPDNPAYTQQRWREFCFWLYDECLVIGKSRSDYARVVRRYNRWLKTSQIYGWAPPDLADRLKSMTTDDQVGREVTDAETA